MIASLRVACPDENTLVAFASGSLPMADAARVEEHLDTCGICFTLVAELARTAPEDAEPTRTISLLADPAPEPVVQPPRVPERQLPPPPRAGKRRPTPILELPRPKTIVRAGSVQPAIEDTVPSVTAIELAPRGDTVIARDLAARGETVIAAVPLPAESELVTQAEPLERAITPSSAPPTQLGRYTILHRVGAGGMGVVYAAHDRELGRRVALKLIDTTGRDAEQCGARLVREVQALGKLAHPNIVAVYDAGCIDGQVFLSMELVEGRTLDAWLGEGPWTWQQKLALFVQAAQGLAAAHAVGIVHRDFKPANVFVDMQGRVRVGDFGLLRALALGPEDAPTTLHRASDSLSQPIARLGAGPGTPAYMAPEQIEGYGDARIDQFAFCVALFEALYGRRPFEGLDAASLFARVSTGVPPVVPIGSDVPSWLGAVVLRGLSREPERRYPSMLALLAGIESSAQRRRKVRIGAGIAAGVLVVGLGSAFVASRVGAGACERGGERLAGVWDPARTEAIAAAITRTGVPYAAASWPGARADVDRWATSWIDAHRRACEATLLDEAKGRLRSACVDRRLQELRGMAAVWAEPDPQIVEHLHDAVAELAPVAVCEDVAPSVVEDPRARERADAVREKLAKARTLEASTSYARALPLAMEAVADAEALHDRGLQGEARMVLGAIQLGAGKLQDGARELDLAMQAAIAGDDPRLFARATAEHAYVAATWLGRPDAALQELALARAALERVPADRELAAELSSREGVAQRQAGRYPEAVAAFERALRERQELHGAEHPSVATALNNVANARTALGQLDVAIAEHQRALAIREKTLGADHPEVAMSLDNLASVLASTGRLDEALASVRRGLALRERVLGPEHARVADSLSNLGVILTELGQADESLASHRRALSIRETALGPDHALVAKSLNDIGFALVQLGRWDEAEATLERAVAVGVRALGPEHPDVATSHFNLGRAAHGRGDYERAASQLQQALVTRVRVLGDRHPTVGTTWAWIARTRRDQRKRAPAREAADAALGIIDAQRDPDAWAQARLVLADVLWDEGERGKARSSVGEALATVKATPSGQSAVAMLGAWQKARGEDEPVVVVPSG